MTEKEKQMLTNLVSTVFSHRERELTDRVWSEIEKRFQKALDARLECKYCGATLKSGKHEIG